MSEAIYTQEQMRRNLNEIHQEGVMQERERIIKLLEEAIRTCKEFIQPGDCDYCVAQQDAIEMIQEDQE